MYEMMVDYVGCVKVVVMLGYVIGVFVVLWMMIGCVVYLLV